MKLAVVIPAHCHPDILRLTLGSLLITHAAHELDIHVGFHSNYIDYCQDTSIFEDLRGIASVHLVKEIDWVAHREDINRYSRMHAKHITFLLGQIRYSAFDYVLLLDNDVALHHDLVAEAPLPADLSGALFNNFATAQPGVRRNGTPFYVLPKIAPWYLLISRRLYNRILENPESVYPEDVSLEDPRYDSLRACYDLEPGRCLFIDTFAGVLHRCHFDPRWRFDVRLFAYDAFQSGLTHFQYSSFNYGCASIPAQELRILEAYRREFPAGVKHVFEAYRQWTSIARRQI